MQILKRRAEEAAEPEPKRVCSLPDELQAHIGRFLELPDLASYARTNKETFGSVAFLAAQRTEETLASLKRGSGHDCFSNPQSLKALSRFGLDQWNPNLEDLALAASLFRWMPRVDWFDLSGTPLTDENAQTLAARISMIPRVKTLTLANCGEGVRRFLGALPRQLETLDLSNNNIGPLDILELAKAISQMPKLRVLILSGNRLGLEGVQNLANIEVIPPLETLQLDQTGIDAEGARTLAHLMRRMGRLSRLTLTNNPLDIPGKDLLERACRQSRTLMTLQI